MFDDKIVKLKKEQFVEAESIAYLIEDADKRKIAFVNTCALFAFKNYAEKNKYIYDPITNINLFRVPAVYEKFEISDVYIGDARVDGRVSFDEKVFPIPKTHIQNSIAADYYVVYKATKNPLKCEGVGYIKKEDLVFDSHDDTYYYISVNILNPIEDLKKEIKDFKKENKIFYETEHKIATENFGAFLDKELDDIKSLDLIEHLLNCENCRSKFVEYSFLEDVLTAVKHYPDLKEQLENDMNPPAEIPITAEPTEAEISLKDSYQNEEIDFSSNEIIDINASNEEIYTDDNVSIDESDNLIIQEDNSYVDLSSSSIIADDTSNENLLIEEKENIDIEDIKINNIIEEYVPDDKTGNTEILPAEQENNIENSEIGVELDIMPQHDESPAIEIENIELNTEPNTVIEDNKNIKNQEEISAPEITYDTNWNELFSGNSKPKKEKEDYEQSQPEVYFADEQDINSTVNSDIESVYNEENIMTDMSEDEISKEIKTHVDKTKSPMGVSIAVVIAIILAIGAAGFFVFHKSSGMLSQNKDSSSENFTPPIDTSNSENMNQAMTNAFSDNQNTLEISNISWQKPEKLVLTNDLKEYLSALGASVWDDLDNDIQSVQGYIASNPAKILVKINTKGEIDSVKVKESSGSAEIDDVIVQAIKKNGAKLTPAAYSILNKNIDLILLVNF